MLQINEITDFLNRAPKKLVYNGYGIQNNSAIRFRWLSEICAGSINQRINRRAGIKDDYIPWKSPTFASVSRHSRKLLKQSH